MIYNRPDLTQKTFDIIRQSKPKQLFIAADGPNSLKIEDESNCSAARAVVQFVDWDCEVFRYYRSKNVGCKKAVIQALDWFFDNVDEGIILEDDCLPSPAFFSFATKMLSKYRHNESIGHISGVNFFEKETALENSYSSIQFANVWGWASWKRVWQKYKANVFEDGDFEFKYLPGTWLQKIYWYHKLFLASTGKIDTWDYQFQYMMWCKNLKSIIPSRNLVMNIGFDGRATHTKSPVKGIADLEVYKDYIPMSKAPVKVAMLYEELLMSKIMKRNSIATVLKFLLFFIQNKPWNYSAKSVDY